MNIFSYEQNLKIEIKNWTYDDVFNYVEGLWEMFAELGGDGCSPTGLQSFNYVVAKRELAARDKDAGYEYL